MNTKYATQWTRSLLCSSAVMLLLALFWAACNSSNGASCASAGGTCTFGSCVPYCAGGQCSTPLGADTQDCPTTNAAGVASGPPCCATFSAEDAGASIGPADAGAPADAEPVEDARVDATGMDAGSTDGALEDTGALADAADDSAVADAGSPGCAQDDGAAGLCATDGGDAAAGPMDATPE